MALVAMSGENRQGKTALFLLLCSCAGVSPHWMNSSYVLIWGVSLAFFLGIHGLRVVLRAREKILEISSEEILEGMEKGKLPSVDVLVAARDEENVVEKLVARLTKLNYPTDKISFSIIDDGSIDRTPVLLEKLTKNILNFQVIRRSRLSGGGKSGALNYALKKTKADWLFILDADAQFEDDVLLRIIPFAENQRLSAIQLRKAVVNPFKNAVASFQAIEMVMDAVIQRGRLLGNGVVELRGNGQLLKRDTLEKCGGFNEDTVTDDLDLSFRLLIAGVSISIIWNPSIQEEAVITVPALFRQRQRWAEGGLQRFFDYWKLLISSKISLLKKSDLAYFFLLQYALPVISFFDLLTSILTGTLPVYWPLSLAAFSLSGLACWQGSKLRSEGPSIPKMGPWNLFLSLIYLGHWFIVIPWVSIKMMLFPKKLIWAKTLHSGD